MLLAAPVPDASCGEPAGLMYLGVSLDTILGVSGGVCQRGAHDDGLGAVAHNRTRVSQSANAHRHKKKIAHQALHECNLHLGSAKKKKAHVRQTRARALSLDTSRTEIST